jgi:hypothetical protein
MNKESIQFHDAAINSSVSRPASGRTKMTVKQIKKGFDIFIRCYVAEQEPALDQRTQLIVNELAYTREKFRRHLFPTQLSTDDREVPLCSVLFKFKFKFGRKVSRTGFKGMRQFRI